MSAINKNSVQKLPTFVLTTPLYYVNDVPHIGSAYTTLAADAIARFWRLQGYEVLLITGTDEHGQKIQRAAASRGQSPQAHCDAIVARFVELWDCLNIQYDRFSRTTSDRHHAIVKAFFQRVWERGDIYLGRQQGWYCVSCEEFKEERDLLTEKRCPLHPNQVVEWRDEQNYFFRLSKYQAQLEQLYTDQPEFIQPDSRRNEVLSFVQQGLQDFSISRVNLDWGFPVPTDPSHTLYVWFDALLGYVTALLDPDAEPTLENAIAHWWPIDLHLIGKDILRFHAVYWPAMQLSAGLPLSRQVFGHGFLTKDGQKMGKSLGNTLDPFQLVAAYGAEALRYYFLKEIEFGRDGDFSEVRFINIVNADLANDLGNLLNRVLKLACRYCEQRVPAFAQRPQEGSAPHSLPADHPLGAIAASLGQQVQQAYGQFAFSDACNACLRLVQAGNKFIDEQAPWQLYKQGQTEQANAVIYVILESVRLAAYLLSPVIPTTSTKIYQQLGFAVDFNDRTTVAAIAPFAQHAEWGCLPPGQALGEPEPVFRRLERQDVAPAPVA